MAFSTKLFSLDVPDEWHEQVVLTFVNPYGSANGHTVNVVSQLFPADAAAVQDYADQQVEHLQHDLRNCRIINRLVYNYGDKPVPISEYSWKNGESEVFQMPGLFRRRRPYLDLHLHLGRGRLSRDQGQHTRSHLPVLAGQ